MSEQITHKSRENSTLWLIKLVTGIFIIFFLAMHLIANHIIPPDGLFDYDDVVKYYDILIIPIIEAAFLICVVAHALIGLRSIFLDLNPSIKVQKIIDVLLILLGSGSIIYGIWLLIIIAQRNVI